MKRFSKLAIPYLVWMALLVGIPVILLFIMVFQNTRGVNISEGTFTFNNFKYLIDPMVINSLWESLKYAFLTTVFCLLIGYPVAFIIAKSHFQNRFLVMSLLILPMWSNTLLRTKAIAGLFQPGNIVSSIVEKMGLSLPTLDMYGSPIAVVIGMVAMYLPFMILPLYTVLEKIDQSLYDASSDLGANSFKTFWKVTVPISLKGVTSGVIMVFLPCATGFGVAEKLGVNTLIGSYIQIKFGNITTYGIGSLISLVILIIITLSIFVVGKVDKEGETLL